MKKFVIALCAALLLMLGCVALAEGVSFNTDKVSAKTYYNNTLGEVGAGDNWTMCIEPGETASTITLKGFKCQLDKINQMADSDYSILFAVYSDLNLILQGENEIRVGDGGIKSSVFAVDGDMSVSGSGILKIAHQGMSRGVINVSNTLTMNSGNVWVANSVNYESMSDRVYGVSAGGIHMKGGALKTRADDCGVYVGGGNVLVDGGSLMAYGDNKESRGLLADGGDIIVKGGELYGEGGALGIVVLGNRAGGNIRATGGRIRTSATNKNSEHLAIYVEGYNQGGYILADSMNVWEIDVDKRTRTPAKIFSFADSGYRASSIYSMNANPYEDMPLAYVEITAPIPKTGDEATLTLWAGLLVLAGAALIIMKKRSFN